jgi:hypothetical protein
MVSFANADEVDVSLVLTGNANTVVQQYVIDNIVNAAQRLFGIYFTAYSAVVNNQVAMKLQYWHLVISLGRSTSYAVADCGYKYMFDKYNNTYRYVPLNGDIAGLCVYTDNVRDPWYLSCWLKSWYN